MTIQTFAEQYRLTTKKDSCDEVIIAGRPRNAAATEYRCHIFEYGSGKFGVCLLMGTTAKWTNRKRTAQAGGFTLGQDGDTEGTLLFDPQDERQSRLAIRLVGAREKTVLSPERLAKLQQQGQHLATMRRT